MVAYMMIAASECCIDAMWMDWPAHAAYHMDARSMVLHCYVRINFVIFLCVCCECQLVLLY